MIGTLSSNCELSFGKCIICEGICAFAAKCTLHWEMHLTHKTIIGSSDSWKRVNYLSPKWLCSTLLIESALTLIAESDKTLIEGSIDSLAESSDSFNSVFPVCLVMKLTLRESQVRWLSTWLFFDPAIVLCVYSQTSHMHLADCTLHNAHMGRLCAQVNAFNQCDPIWSTAWWHLQQPNRGGCLDFLTSPIMCLLYIVVCHTDGAFQESFYNFSFIYDKVAFCRFWPLVTMVLFRQIVVQKLKVMSRWFSSCRAPAWRKSAEIVWHRTQTVAVCRDPNLLNARQGWTQEMLLG